jgi:DNA-binding CsgD family transcriptional regulator
MEAHPIHNDAALSGGFGRSLIGLVDSVGRQKFPAALFGLAHEMTGCKHLTAFSFDGDGAPRVVLAENIGTGDVAFSVAQKYVSRYWRLDPANRVASIAKATDGCWSVKSSASDIADSVYRAYCYNAVGLHHRLAISQHRDGRTYRLNFYMDSGRTFDEAAAGNIMDAADLLMALTRRHDAAGVSAPETVEDFAQRLRRLAPVLSARELDVTALIARGLSSQAIALRLGISVNTVLTYRKRAYARLNISTQNELMQLLLGTRSLI